MMDTQGLLGNVVPTALLQLKIKIPPFAPFETVLCSRRHQDTFVTGTGDIITSVIVNFRQVFVQKQTGVYPARYEPGEGRQDLQTELLLWESHD